MTRLIDADALSKKICETTIFIKGGEIFQRMINDAPTIEPNGDLISRESALAEFRDGRDVYDIMESIEELPSAETPTVLKKHQLSEETPTNTATNLISRQDAVNEIHKYFVEEIDKTPTKIDEDGDELYADMPTVNSLLACNKELSKRIKSLQSAPDSRQRGEWIDNHNGTFTCDQCGWKHSKSNFCPNCGADMRGGEEE